MSLGITNTQPELLFGILRRNPRWRNQVSYSVVSGTKSCAELCLWQSFRYKPSAGQRISCYFFFFSVSVTGKSHAFFSSLFHKFEFHNLPNNPAGTCSKYCTATFCKYRGPPKVTNRHYTSPSLVPLRPEEELHHGAATPGFPIFPAGLRVPSRDVGYCDSRYARRRSFLSFGTRVRSQRRSLWR